jgi:hypothetical protein
MLSFRAGGVGGVTGFSFSHRAELGMVRMVTAPLLNDNSSQLVEAVLGANPWVL